MKAYSLLNVKSVDDERRVITGIASTPSVDRMGDEVVSTGAKFKTPMPLLLYHKSDLPVGNVTFAKPTKEGIPFTAVIPKVDEAGTIRDRVDEAWHSIKYRLIGAVSIGFRPLENGVELLKSGGLKFTSWEWLELSLVAIPAQPEAVINGFKSFDAQQVRELIGSSDADESERNEILKTLQPAPAPLSKQARRPVRLLPDASGAKAAKRGAIPLDI